MRAKNHRSTKVFGFSLVELMIVVVIVSILAAVAIPIYARYIRKSRTSEAISNLGTIAMFEETYFSEADSYITCDINPDTVPSAASGTGRLPFDEDQTGWAQLGRVIPDETPLYFQYEVRAGRWNNTGGCEAGSFLVCHDVAVKPGRDDCTNIADTDAETGLGLSPPSGSGGGNWFYATAVGNQAGGGSDTTCSLFIKVIDRPDIVIQNPIE